MTFKLGEQYVGVLMGGLAFVGAMMVISTSIVGNPSLGFVSFPLFGVFLLCSEIRSGITLDGLGYAKYSKGTRQYSMTLAWRIIWIIGTSVMAYVAIAAFAFPRKS
jgi:hypothetical protein